MIFKTNIEGMRNRITYELNVSKDILARMKNKGIYEFFPYGLLTRKSLGISCEDLDDEKDVYIYNIFVGGDHDTGGEYINISNRGTKDNPLPTEVLEELVEVWNSFEG